MRWKIVPTAFWDVRSGEGTGKRMLCFCCGGWCICDHVVGSTLSFTTCTNNRIIIIITPTVSSHWGEEAESEEKLVEVVAETMVTLGMSAHTDRMIKLLVENGVTNTAVLERLLVHGIPRVSLLYSSLSCATSCLLTSFSLQAQRYESNTSTTSALSTLCHLILIELCWCLPVFCRVLLIFVPFWKGFFSIQHPQHPPSQAGLIMAKKKPRSQWWSMHGTQFAMGLGGSCTKNVGLPKRWTWDTWIPRSGWVSQKTFRFLLFEILSWECILLDWQCVYFDLDSSIYHYIVCLACYLKWNQHLCIDILYIWKFILCTHCI